MKTCGRCHQSIKQHVIPNNPQTWVSVEDGALCTWTSPAGQEMTGAHCPDDQATEEDR